MPRKEELEKRYVQDVLSEASISRQIKRALIGLKPSFSSAKLGDELSGIVDEEIKGERKSIDRIVWRIANKVSKHPSIADRLRDRIDLQERNGVVERRERREVAYEDRKRDDERRRVEKEERKRVELERYREDEERRRMQKEEEYSSRCERVGHVLRKIEEALMKRLPGDARNVDISSPVEVVEATGKVCVKQVDGRNRRAFGYIEVDL